MQICLMDQKGMLPTDLSKTVTVQSRHAKTRQRGITVCTESCWMVQGSCRRATLHQSFRHPHHIDISPSCSGSAGSSEGNSGGMEKQKWKQMETAKARWRKLTCQTTMVPRICVPRMCTALFRLYTQIKSSHRINIINITTSGTTWCCFLVFLQIWVSSDSSIFGVGGLGRKTSCACQENKHKINMINWLPLVADQLIRL